MSFFYLDDVFSDDPFTLGLSLLTLCVVRSKLRDPVVAFGTPNQHCLDFAFDPRNDNVLVGGFEMGYIAQFDRRKPNSIMTRVYAHSVRLTSWTLLIHNDLCFTILQCSFSWFRSFYHID